MSGSGDSFVKFVQLHSDQSAMMLKAKGVMGYPVHPLLFSFSCHWPDRVIYNCHIVVGFLSVDSVKYLEWTVADDATSIYRLTSILQLNWSLCFRLHQILHVCDKKWRWFMGHGTFCWNCWISLHLEFLSHKLKYEWWTFSFPRLYHTSVP